MSHRRRTKDDPAPNEESPTTDGASWGPTAEGPAHAHPLGDFAEEDEGDATVVSDFNPVDALQKLKEMGKTPLGERSHGSDPTAQIDVSALVAASKAMGNETTLDGPDQKTGWIRGRYALGKMIGKGGMGRVYRARDMELGREIALKLLPSKVASDEDARHVFSTEARSLAAVNHPNVISVFDILDEDGNLFMAMEFVDGMRLDEFISRQRDALDIGEAVELAIQLLSAVAHLHSRNIIHRDLKPNNVMVDHDGAIRVMDFGLARDEDRMRKVGTLVRGTPSYMSPEQIRGRELTAATDVYAFGVTFYEILTGGRLPFDRSDPGFAHVSEPPRPITDWRDDLPEAIVEVVDACLAKVPEDRPSARQLIWQLLPLASKNSISYLPPCVLPGMREEADTLDIPVAVRRKPQGQAPEPEPINAPLAAPAESAPATIAPGSLPRAEPEPETNWVVVAIAAAVTLILGLGLGLGVGLAFGG